MFLNAPAAGLSTAGDFHVLAGSPAIDMGNDLANNYPTDLDGLPRKINTIDIGAYEYNIPPIDCNLYTLSLIHI